MNEELPPLTPDAVDDDVDRFEESRQPLSDFIDQRSALPRAATNRSLWLSRTDQAAVALLVIGCLGALGAWWYVRGGARGELIEFDDAEPLSAQYVVDVNSAAWYEFEPLPNVGEKLARRIVESREQEGPFESLEDLARIDGISLKTVERLRPYLRIGPAAPQIAQPGNPKR
jgi:competence protein ComEA